MKKYLLILSSILLAGCLKTETRNPFPSKDRNKHEASPVTTDVATVSTDSTARTCGTCDANRLRILDLEGEAAELRWLLDPAPRHDDNPLWSEPF